MEKSERRAGGRICVYCKKVRANVKRPKTGDAVCRDCFYSAFEDEVHSTIVHEKLFCAGETVAIGASGGKDSTVLAYILQLLNERHNYGLNLLLLSIDEGIAGYRDDSLRAVQRHSEKYNLPLEVLPYEDLFGWSMDQVVAQQGRRANCTYCGVFRRQALDRGAMKLKADKLVTGHNADDIAETVLLNLLRGDFPRLSRCASASTQADSASCEANRQLSIPRVKPFKWTYEKEIVMYAYFKELDYFATECIYSPEAFRGFARAFIKDIEAVRPSAIADTIVSAQCFEYPSTSSDTVKSHLSQTLRECKQCGYMTSQPTCKACELLNSLNARKEQLKLDLQSDQTHFSPPENASMT
eukprot:CAMPEP_0182442110 /NCGR_PEP_ID=MMETSP1172-20130603/1069_1 /TAXON_ID=708627 /ORGANISM="Timspurckia oligopyrenoides, Strain CCMP3278" /LENGTH=354 /DNA_ID=CAMNT_0024636813 /DNA_START=1328 /DNA_END=2392 /DNA_ORIENTATION=+